MTVYSPRSGEVAYDIRVHERPVTRFEHGVSRHEESVRPHRRGRSGSMRTISASPRSSSCTGIPVHRPKWVAQRSENPSSTARDRLRRSGRTVASALGPGDAAVVQAVRRTSRPPATSPARGVLASPGAEARCRRRGTEAARRLRPRLRLRVPRASPASLWRTAAPNLRASSRVPSTDTASMPRISIARVLLLVQRPQGRLQNRLGIQRRDDHGHAGHGVRVFIASSAFRRCRRLRSRSAARPRSRAARTRGRSAASD